MLDVMPNEEQTRYRDGNLMIRFASGRGENEQHLLRKILEMKKRIRQVMLWKCLQKAGNVQRVILQRKRKRKEEI
jgi:hypothetical protein